MTDAAVSTIADLGARQAAGDATPFALTVGWLLPHAPYVCDPELYASYEGKVPPPAIPVPADEHPHYAWWRTNRSIATALAGIQHETLRAAASRTDGPIVATGGGVPMSGANREVMSTSGWKSSSPRGISRPERTGRLGLLMA